MGRVDVLPLLLCLNVRVYGVLEQAVETRIALRRSSFYKPSISFELRLMMLSGEHSKTIKIWIRFLQKSPRGTR